MAILDVEGFPIQRTWNLVYPKGKELSVVAKAFADFLIGEEGKLAAKLDKTLKRLCR